jgi:glycosyltransferase involved in cell wall biosynthesis
VERDYFENVFTPALKAAGPSVEYLGELDQSDRDELFAQSYATLMPGSWPEPFGLVLIESLACGTPVIARRIGALPEILRDGVDGYFGDDVTAMAFHVDRVGDLDRRAIRESVIDRFSVERMTDRYEAVYATMLSAGASSDAHPDDGDDADASEPEQLADHRPDRIGALARH